MTIQNLVKNGRKIVGFIFKDDDGAYWFAFGKPSQASYMSWQCKSVEDGLAMIQIHSGLYSNAKLA